ncbi:MAG: hypothetical protein IKR52_02890 [Paludibacteraceae bacterium]|nr:hypothetical protein [Paludibacteraceae bacterium]
MKKLFTFFVGVIMAMAANAGEPRIPVVLKVSDVANYIDFQALSKSDAEMTKSTVTSTNTYTLANGSVLKGFKRDDDSEVDNRWVVKDDYEVSIITPSWDGVDTLKIGTIFRAASGTSISLGAFTTSAEGKLVVYYQPNGDSERGVSITVKGEPVEGTHLRGSGVKIDGIRPAYAGEITLPKGTYAAGDVVITAVVNTSNIFGVGIEKLQPSYTLELVSNNSEWGKVEVTDLQDGAIVDNEDGTYTIPENQEVTIVATASEGYMFQKWSEGSVGDEVSCSDCWTANDTQTTEFVITMTEDKAIMATFVKAYTLELVSNNSEWGKVEVADLQDGAIVDNQDGTYTVPENQEVTIVATAFEGYKFSEWSEGNVGDLASCGSCWTVNDTKAAQLVINMTEDKAVLAVFEEANDGIEDVQSDSKAQCKKVLRDNSVFIERGGKIYSILGVEVK